MKYTISIPDDGPTRVSVAGIRLEKPTGRPDENRADAWPSKYVTSDPEQVKAARAAGLSVEAPARAKVLARTSDDPGYEFEFAP